MPVPIASTRSEAAPTDSSAQGDAIPRVTLTQWRDDPYHI